MTTEEKLLFFSVSFALELYTTHFVFPYFISQRFAYTKS